MTTLITGGAGFIGNQLAARLLELQQPVVILDNFDDYYDPAIKRAKIAARKLKWRRTSDEWRKLFINFHSSYRRLRFFRR